MTEEKNKYEKKDFADLLSADFKDCTAFPIDALPEVLMPFVLNAAESILCPVDFIAVPLLTSLGATIGRSRVIEMKTGWTESSALWTVVVATSGSAKSPALKLATKPLQEIDNVKTSKNRRFIVSDATVEALAVVMQKNPFGVILIRDELAGWLNSMNQYKGKGADEQFFLSVWSGGNIRIDRKNLEDGQICIPESYLAICGTVQPSVLKQLLTKQRHEEGLASRLLMVYPEEKQRRWNTCGIDEKTMEPVKKLFAKLAELNFNDNKPVVVKFSPDGYRAFSEVMDEHFSQCGKYSLNENLKAYWAKMEGYTGRLCLIIHLARLHSGETSSEQVDAESVYMAAAFIDYFKAHVVKFDRQILGNNQKSLSERVLDWMKKHELERVELRHFLTSKIVSNMQDAVDIFDFIIEHGFGEWGDDKKRLFVLYPTQQSATQQKLKCSAENKSKWLQKLREVRKNKNT